MHDHITHKSLPQPQKQEPTLLRHGLPSSADLSNQISQRAQLFQDLKHLQSQKSNLQSKDSIYENYAQLKGESQEKDFRIAYLEKVGKEKDEKVRELEMKLFDKQEEIKGREEEKAKEEERWVLLNS